MAQRSVELVVVRSRVAWRLSRSALRHRMTRALHHANDLEFARAKPFAYTNSCKHHEPLTAPPGEQQTSEASLHSPLTR